MTPTASTWEDPTLMEDFFEECISLNGDTLKLNFEIFDQVSGTEADDHGNTNKTVLTSGEDEKNADELQRSITAEVNKSVQ